MAAEMTAGEIVRWLGICSAEMAREYVAANKAQLNTRIAERSRLLARLREVEEMIARDEDIIGQADPEWLAEHETGRESQQAEDEEELLRSIGSILFRR